MATRDIVVVGTSAGGIATLKELVRMLSPDIPAAIIVVQHLAPGFPSTLDHILQRKTKLPVKFASDGEGIGGGHIYIAPPDNHLLVERGRLRVVRGPRENLHRPAIDPLFRSAAWAYGPRAVGVVLSGTMDDGASGLWAIRSCGGITIVQDPEEAKHGEMPTSALMTLNVDHVEPLSSIAKLLEHFSRQSIDDNGAPKLPEPIQLETAVATREVEMTVEDMRKLGKPSGFSCPACHGGLWELNEGELVIYRCHVGHAFAPESLHAAQSAEVEGALESALRALEEQGAAARRLWNRYEQTVPMLAARYDAQAKGLEARAAVIRKLLRDGVTPND